MHSPLKNLVIRVDSLGSGHYNAKRGKRLHRGVDFVSSVGESVYAPMAGVVRILQVYEDARLSHLTGIEIKGSEFIVKLFYVHRFKVKSGQQVAKGDVIGQAQAVAASYSSKMLNHVHMEVTDLKGQHYNPLNFVCY